jgi:glutamate N-acetyltransferase/amino-acid N-acetyltransferase
MNGAGVTMDGGITFPQGFRSSGVACGIKRSFRPDLALVVTDTEAAAAGVFTTNRIRAAPVVLTEDRLARTGGKTRGVLVVSGVANALTGPEGRKDSELLLDAAERSLGVPAGSLYHAATGVIGPRIPVDLVTKHIPEAVGFLEPGRNAARRSASAIMTTDTVAKEAAVVLRRANGTKFRVGGMAKGSGMIAPALGPPHATTLGFLSTDCPATPEGLQKILSEEADRTFNMVCVDGDTSTNDTLLVFANGRAGGAPADEDPALRAGIGQVLEQLARAVARDGEGATKMLTVKVSGAADTGGARLAARAIARSVLVKTALFGSDPNVGRIACALGYSGAGFELDELRVDLEDGNRRWPLIQEGHPVPGLDNGAGKRLHTILQRMDEVVLRVELGQGPAGATAWGCDLSYGYVQINAQYRT